MSETPTPDPELVARLTDRLARDAAACGRAVRARSRSDRATNLDLTIGTLAKELSKRAAGSVEDRRSRQLARTDAYNAVRPVLETLADRHGRLLRRGRWVALGAAAASAAIVACVAFRLS
jgi:hypothetical protein